MKEIEVKILKINKEKVEAKLKSLGAKKIFDGQIQTIFFDFEDRRIIKAKDVLRLRTAQEKVELTYKKVYQTQTAKKAEEYTVDVSDLESMEEILKNLGLRVTETMQKHRLSYKLNSARFDIDRYLGGYDFIPEFLEIEAENIETIHKCAELLGFKPEDCLPWSTDELIHNYLTAKKE